MGLNIKSGARLTGGTRSVAYWPSDPYIDYTTLLLSGNNINKANNHSFLDGSTNNFAITRNGNATQGTFSPFSPSGWGNYVSANNYLTVADNAAFQFGSGDYTIECWINLSAITSSGGIFGYGLVGVLTNSWALEYYSATSALSFWNYNANSSIYIINGTTNPANNQWTHVAVSRSGNNTRLFVNGTQEGATYTSTYTNGTGNSFYIGTGFYAPSTRTVTGYISNLRIVKGTGLYTANFTPSTTPLTAVSGTTLLTCQANRFFDASSNALTISPTGSPTVVAFSPFNPPVSTEVSRTGSVYFDGNGDYLTYPPGNTLKFGTNNFTVEAWVYRTGGIDATYGSYIIDARDASNTGAWIFTFDSTSIIWYDGASSLTSSGTVPVGTWTHIAYSRSGTTGSLFVNGTRTATWTDSKNYTVSGTTAYIASRFSAQGLLNGYLSSVRVVNGTAVYDPTLTTCTVPTAPLTAITNTSFLTCTGDKISDQSNNNFAITVVGDTKVQALNPYNSSNVWLSASTYGGSGYFDGNGDYLSVADNAAFDFGSGDFTIECWAYTETFASQYNVLVSQWNISYSFIFRITSSLVGLYINVGNPYTLQDYTASVTNTTGQWNHFCVTRSGSTLTFYKNGNSIGTSSISATITNAASDLTVGVIGDLNAATYHKGYISGMRLIKGTAVAPTITTPPTAIENTSLLLNFDNAGVYDSTGRNNLETVGDAQISTAQKKWGSSSISFDGTGDFLTASDKPELRMGTSDFTIECWAYVSGGSSYRAVVSKGAAATGWLIFVDTTGYWAFTLTSTNYVGSIAMNLNTWTHLALTRIGNVFTLYVDGVQANSQTISVDLNQTDQLVIGANRSNLDIPFTGYIQDLRITKGIARYTANFTPPTAAFPTRG